MTVWGVTFIKNPSICDSVGHAISTQQYEVICCEHSTSPWNITIPSVPLTWIIMPTHQKHLIFSIWNKTIYTPLLNLIKQINIYKVVSIGLFKQSQTRVLNLRFPGEQVAAKRHSWRHPSPLVLGFKPVQCEERGGDIAVKLDNLMLNSFPLPATELHLEILGLS